MNPPNLFKSAQQIKSLGFPTLQSSTSIFFKKNAFPLLRLFFFAKQAANDCCNKGGSFSLELCFLLSGTHYRKTFYHLNEEITREEVPNIQSSKHLSCAFHESIIASNKDHVVGCSGTICLWLLLTASAFMTYLKKMSTCDLLQLLLYLIHNLSQFVDKDFHKDTEWENVSVKMLGLEAAH